MMAGCSAGCAQGEGRIDRKCASARSCSRQRSPRLLVQLPALSSAVRTPVRVHASVKWARLHDKFEATFGVPGTYSSGGSSNRNPTLLGRSCSIRCHHDSVSIVPLMVSTRCRQVGVRWRAPTLDALLNWLVGVSWEARPAYGCAGGYAGRLRLHRPTVH